MKRRDFGRFGFGSLLAAMVASPTQAADIDDAITADIPALEIARPFWQGPYVGIRAGVVAGRFNQTRDNLFPALFGADSFKHDPDGGVLGVQAGYNVQRSQWVFGIEADIAKGAIKGDQGYSFNVAFLGADTVAELQTTELRYLATLRGRVGIDLDHVLIYATGGPAFGKIHSTFSFSVSGPGLIQDFAIAVTDDVTHFGYAIGGGFEIPLSGGFTISAEYLYMDLGEKEHSVAVVLPSDPYSLDLHLLRAGINYHF